LDGTKQRHQGDYVGSEATAERHSLIENTDKYPNGKWNIYNQLGNNYLYTLNFDNALYYFNKALNLKRIKSTKPVFKQYCFNLYGAARIPQSDTNSLI
jgi:hypothetical protein